MVHIENPNIIAPESERKSKKVDREAISKFFSEPSKLGAAQEEPEPRKKRAENITAENLSKLESIDIKEDWQKVKPATKTTDVSWDLRAIKPSRAGIEEDTGGVRIISENRSTILEPDKPEKASNSEYTKHVLDAGKQRREQRQNKGKPTKEARGEWEQVSPAKKTSDVSPGAMGFTPNRTAFEQAKPEKVEIKQVEKAIKGREKSREAGEKAAAMKRELDAERQADREKTNTKNWEDGAAYSIRKTETKEMTVGQEKIEFAKEEVLLKKSELDLNGIFPLPEDPSIEEKSIRRETSSLREKRTKREDDRSWERVAPSKKR